MERSSQEIIKLYGRVQRFTPISSTYDRNKYRIFKMNVDRIVNLTQNYSENAAPGVTSLLVFDVSNKLVRNLTNGDLIAVDGVVGRMEVTSLKKTLVFFVREANYVSSKGY